MPAEKATRDLVRTADGTPLKVRLRRAERARKIASVGLTVPLLLFLLVFFIIPIWIMLSQSVDNPEAVKALPRTAEKIKAWSGEGLPDEPVYAALAADLAQARDDRAVIGRFAKRLNYEIEGFRTLIFRSAERAAVLTEGPYKEAMVKIDRRWGDRNYLAAIKRNAGAYTDFYLLASLDRQRNADGAVEPLPANQAIFVDMLARTVWISFLVTLGCFVLGYPVAYLLATLPTRSSNLLMFFVLLPFWVSLMVRTIAWIALLQQQGLINDSLLALGLISERLILMFNRPGVLISMIHVMLPFMILPLYSVMKGINPQHVRAAQSLGASPSVAFRRVYFPQTVPGINAGCLLVFIIALGYYITPTLVGGPKDQMISSFIALYVNEQLNWGQAAALGVILLTVVIVLYALYHRVGGTRVIRMG